MGLDHLALLRAELAAFQRCLGGDLSAPVEHCPGWTLRELAAHLGEGNLWAAAAVTERHGRHQPPPAPEDIVPWVAASGDVLTGALAVDPGTEAWTFWPPRTVGFWRRRRWLETLVHRWDAEHALGVASVLDPEHCADGIAEIGDTFLPRQVERGRMAVPSRSVCFVASDLDRSWVLGPGEPVSTLRGTAAEILLALWNRRPWAELAGDHRAARAALPGPLVP
ncbi:maleylpyruvate isomerase family mycothiol-dependent enzyme [Actinoplanes siamensis]|uniref:Mycothiol-dependent maleylpyruvate isomerase metal-binding domain-containing protein n=1 Tax=Actinoplanes siamensis TaxID=1223317 RepID=A0A919KC24_9ACTN|nr:maleylpyruvate isomerase family mycothiol-dependent enzyme [Actinoplanes siamensis]GIF02589.1 hypothetical protein Asi03nite_01270 [Actinoplanes siamensis]